jgi:hypothetical protein
MDLERIVILSFALLYGVWGLLLIGHSLLQMRKKSYMRKSVEDKDSNDVSAGVDDTDKVA